MSAITALGVDLAKNIFQIHAVNRAEKQVFNKKVRRSQLVEQIIKIPPCVIFMEACGGAHYWAKRFQDLGYEVRLIAGQHVKKFVSGNKNDAIDARAIVTAGLRPDTRFVPVKEKNQLAIQALHRIRTRLVKERTALANETRSILYEQGIVIPKTRARLIKAITAMIAENELSRELDSLMISLLNEYLGKDKRISEYERQIADAAKNDPRIAKLQTIPGVGLLTASAIAAEVSDPKIFRRGRDFSAFLGLIPRHSGSGGKNVNYAISKRGDSYIRTLLIHGARSSMRFTSRRTDKLSKWVEKLSARIGKNKATVALANKNARIIWKMLVDESVFDSKLAAT